MTSVYSLVIVECEYPSLSNYYMFNMTHKELIKFHKSNIFDNSCYCSEDILLNRDNLVAKNLTDLQLKKFKLTKSKEVWKTIYEEEDRVEETIREECFKPEWQNKIDKVNEELEVAKYNPRNPLGKLEFDRRAEADGIIFEK